MAPNHSIEWTWSSYQTFGPTKAASAVLVALISLGAEASEPSYEVVVRAAEHFASEVRWDPASVLVLDFTCRGRREFALLGRTPATQVLVEGRSVGQRESETVVAVFSKGPSNAPVLLRLPGVQPASAQLAIEPVGTSKELRAELGKLPTGWRESRTCKGLSLSDGMRDAVHLYWQPVAGHIGSWSR